MLSETNIAQILEEHQVLEQEPEAAEQHLDVVLLAIGERRADLRKRDSRLEDGVFAAWAICLPGWPQDARYHSLMRARRAQWFTNISIRTASRRAAGYFTTELLGLELHQLGALVNARNATDLIRPYLGDATEIA